jgi:hypothetical protein
MLRLLAIMILILPVLWPSAWAQEDLAEDRCFDLAGEQVCISQADYVADVCAAIDVYATHYGLPSGFLARLIWQESRFDPQAISPAGAQGIAQFMTGTARLRNLQDPFDPAEALARSAEYLRFLELKFGNLGLAAAAYNGGENRIAKLVAGSGGVAGETRAFVSIITGRPVDYWLGETAEPANFSLHPEKPFREACVDMASAVPMPDFLPEQGEWQPWGVLIAQNFSAEIARANFDRAQAEHESVFADHAMLFITVRNLSLGSRLRYSAQVGFATREEADAFCQDLLADGGNCIVQRNGA